MILTKEKILNTRLLSDQMAFFYLGQVGFLLKCNEKYLLIDGYLTDYVDRHCCNDLVVWRRRYPAPITAAELDFVDYVFCTHAHYDHADPDTLAEIARVNRKAKFFVTEPIRTQIADYGVGIDRVMGLNTDSTVRIDDVLTVKAIPAAHEDIHRDSDGNCEEVGFLFRFGMHTVYHAGDCCPYNGLAERIKGTEVMILPINGRDYYRTAVKDIIGCFDSNEAITLASDAGAGLLIPVHFDLYDVNAVNPAYFVDCLIHKAPELPFHIFVPGERYIFS